MGAKAKQKAYGALTKLLPKTWHSRIPKFLSPPAADPNNNQPAATAAVPKTATQNANTNTGQEEEEVAENKPPPTKHQKWAQEANNKILTKISYHY